MKNRNLLLDLSKRSSLIINNILYCLMALRQFVMLSFESNASINNFRISFNSIENLGEVSMIIAIDMNMEIQRKYG
jgi:hypothetical protein